jgi:hypothetical protein
LVVVPVVVLLAALLVAVIPANTFRPAQVLCGVTQPDREAGAGSAAAGPVRGGADVKEQATDSDRCCTVREAAPPLVVRALACGSDGARLRCTLWWS